MSKQKIYAIVDLETTGGMPHRDKIIEIGIVLYDGENIIDRYETLVDPERTIPPNITKITGIDTQMIEGAPRFYEVARRVVELTDGAIFVAHNVNFDYGFLREEFKRLGFTFTRRKMCTVRLSRKTFPGLRSYSLGNLIKHFDINVNARHRALDDALTTTELLKKILKEDHSEHEIKQLINHGVRESKLPPNIDLEKLHKLPETCGVYYMHNSFEQVVYVGKSVNIQKRIMQHFAETTRKADKMRNTVHEISYEETGSELLSMIMESYEIKRLQPEINKAQRAKDYPWVVYTDYNEEGYKVFRTGRNNKQTRENFDIIHTFPKERSAKSSIRSVVHHFELCGVINELETSMHSCFNYKIGKCLGACIGEETVEDYNLRFDEAKYDITHRLEGSFLLMEEGKDMDEQVIFQVEHGRFIGYGVVNSDHLQIELESMLDYIESKSSNQEIEQIILRYINSKPGLNIFPYEPTV